MHVTTCLPPPDSRQDHMYKPPGSASWLTVLQPRCKTEAPSDDDTSPKPRQIKPDSTSAHPRQEDPQNMPTSGLKDVPSSVDNGSSSSGASRRTVFTRHQLSELETRFREQTFLSKEERAQMAEDLELTERQIMIWFQNRRGRLKRRGPSDNAYTADKLKELNTRRPYPFLYGLLSSMQYRYPEGHQHPYQHLMADRNQGNPNTPPQTVQGNDVTPHHTQPINVYVPNTVTSHNDVSTSSNTSSNSPPGCIPHNVTVPGVSVSGPMPPNVSIHQMTWSSHQQRGHGTSGRNPPHHHSPPGVQGGYPGVPGWMASRAGPIRHTQPFHHYHEGQHPYPRQGHHHNTPWAPTTMSIQTPPSYHYPAQPSSMSTPLSQLPYCPPQGPTPYTTDGHFAPRQRGRSDPQSGRGSPSGERVQTTPPPVTHASPISSASSASPPDLAGRPPHVAVVQATCLGQNAGTTSGYLSGLSSSSSSSAHPTFHDFNPQFDFGFVPDFPDITSTLYPHASQTC